MTVFERVALAYSDVFEAAANDSVERPTVFYLHKQDVQRHECKGDILRVLAGTAWLTIDGRDVVMRKGDEWVLSPGKYPALVSSVNGQSLVYELCSHG